jgi:hypothetical protein
MPQRVWETDGVEQLDSTLGYIAEREESAVHRLHRMVTTDLDKACTFQHVGRPDRVACARKLFTARTFSPPLLSGLKQSMPSVSRTLASNILDL